MTSDEARAKYQAQIEAKDIRDKAAALEAYARQKNDIEMERWVAEIKLRAITRIGEISAELEKAPTRVPEISSHRREVIPKAEILKRAGISTSAARVRLCAGLL